MANAQKWLDQNYPKKERINITKLNLNYRNLEGDLNFESFINLENLECSDNKLKTLDISDCSKLKYFCCNNSQLVDLILPSKLPQLGTFDCYNNYLTKINYSALNISTLTYLRIRDNNLEGNIEIFENFVCLKNLHIGNNYKEKIEKGIYNRFTGSLSSLKNLTELEMLGINNTDVEIDRDLNSSLPSSLSYIWCSNDELPNSKVGEVRKTLESSSSFFLNKVNDTYYYAKKNDSQQWLNNNYPKSERKQITKLDSGMTKLQGHLDLSDFENLTEIVLTYGELEKLTLGNKPYLVKLKVSFECECKLKELDVTGCPNLEMLDCSAFPANDLLTKLDLSKNPNLIQLNCSNNKKLKELDLSKNKKLTYLMCDGNTFGNLDLSNNLELTDLLCRNMSTLINLDLSKNTKLTNFESDSTVILDNIKENIILGDFSLRDLLLSDFDASADFFKLAKKEENKNSENGKLKLSSTTLVENFFNWKTRQEINWNKKETKKKIFYDEIRPKNSFEWKINIGELSQGQLPTRLYNIMTKEVVKIKKNDKLSSYAIISYVWGNNEDPKNKLLGDEKKELNNVFINIGYDNSNLMTGSGYKVWKKAIETCRHLGINCFWMDQLCINQNDNSDKEQEVSKMRQYYKNATITLIAIDENSLDDSKTLPSFPHLLKRIIESQWFSRSWTFQEGFLSRQTLFMFNDCLIDGRILAGVWALNQQKDVDHGRYNNLGEFGEGSRKIATPIGWTYYRNGYDSEDLVLMTLSQSLMEIKNRSRSIPIDGIYSILGLLPYGDQVEVKYEKWGHKYTEKELQESLSKVMKVAVKNGYGEPLAWHGEEGELNWLPKIKEDGSAEIEWWLDVNCHPESITFMNDNKIKIRGWGCIIEKIHGSIGGYTGNSSYHKHLKISFNNGQSAQLLGTEETLNELEIGDTILILNKEEWKSEGEFGLILEKSKLGSYYCKKGLVEFGDEKGIKKIKNTQIFQDAGKEEFTIGQDYQGGKLAKWRIISQDFWDSSNNKPNEKLIKEWTNQGFSFVKVKLWIKLTDFIKPNDVEFVQWLRDVKKVEVSYDHINWVGNRSFWNPEERQAIIEKLRMEFDSEKVTQIQISPKQNLSEQITLFGQEENIDPQIINLALKWIKEVENKSIKGKINNQEHLEEINNLQNSFDKLERLKKELRELQTNIEIPPK